MTDWKNLLPNKFGNPEHSRAVSIRELSVAKLIPVVKITPAVLPGEDARALPSPVSDSLNDYIYIYSSNKSVTNKTWKLLLKGSLSALYRQTAPGGRVHPLLRPLVARLHTVWSAILFKKRIRYPQAVLQHASLREDERNRSSVDTGLYSQSGVTRVTCDLVGIGTRTAHARDG